MPSIIAGAHRRLFHPPPPVRVAAPARPAAAAGLPPLLPHQTPPPGDWRGWLLLAGRGAGKTYAGARWLYAQHARVPYLRAIGPTYADARDVCVEGESGILAIARPAVEAWNRSLGELRFTNGARLKLFSADEPDRLRGPQSGADWYDELAAWRYAEATLDMALMGLRLGADPRYVATTTPRPVAAVRRLLADPHVVTTRARTFDNVHLPDAFKQVILARYEGTRLGRQELDAELLDDVPGALWTLDRIEASRVRVAPPLVRVVVGVDPKAGGDADHGGETGIVVAGRDAQGHGYTLADMSTAGGPGAWAPAVIAAARIWQADAVVVETNNGGAMVEHTLRLTAGGANLPIVTVWASRGKIARAEPVAMLMEQGKDHHVGAFPELEGQLTTWVPGEDSPDRLDAKVWAYSELFPATDPAVRVPRLNAAKPNVWSQA